MISRFAQPGQAWRAYGLAAAMVATATLVNHLLFGRITEPSLVMIYFLALLPVALSGSPGAAILAALLSVGAFNFFFTEPYMTLQVNDTRYYFTFLVMGLVGALVSWLTARLAAELKTSQGRTLEAEGLSRELEKANQQLTLLDRMKADLISNVSHELRTPLTVITGNAELLQDQAGGPMTPAQQELVAQLQQGASRLGRMVDALVDYAKLEAGSFTFDMQAIDLRDLVRHVVDGAVPQAQAAGLSLRARLPEAPVTVEVDAQRISQVLLNLLDNAIKFTKPGGRIDVALQLAPGSSRVEVRDTGIGIAAEHLPHLFTKFYQVDASSTRAFGGAGLGLAFSKALVEAQGGQVGVESELDRGSTFWFSLPQAEAAPDALDPVG